MFNDAIWFELPQAFMYLQGQLLATFLRQLGFLQQGKSLFQMGTSQANLSTIC